MTIETYRSWLSTFREALPPANRDDHEIGRGLEEMAIWVAQIQYNVKYPSQLNRDQLDAVSRRMVRMIEAATEPECDPLE